MNKSSNNKIPFGLKNGRPVHVSEVESGLACGCVCPSCKRKLQANKGKIVSHYFSHDPSSGAEPCESALETSVHLMAKQILSEEGVLIIPGLTISMSKSDANGNVHVEEMSIEEQVRKDFEKVELEKRLGEIRPDIIAYTNGVPLLIEVAVTSFADEKKKKIIRNLDLSAIEIDLSYVHYAITKEDLRKLINDSLTKMKWISNPKAINAKKGLSAKLDEKIRVINEGIYRAREKFYKQTKTPIRRAPKKIEGTGSNVGQSVSKQYGQRWFVCEACRHIFSVPIQNAPYSIETIPCPECEHAVSAKP